MEEKVIVEFFLDGTVTVEVDGVKGPICKDITEAIQRRLGGTVLESQDKPEMYMEMDGLGQKIIQGA